MTPSRETLGKAAYNMRMFKSVANGKPPPPAWETLSEGEKEAWRQRGEALAKGSK